MVDQAEYLHAIENLLGEILEELRAIRQEIEADRPEHLAAHDLMSPNEMRAMAMVYRGENDGQG